MASLPPGLHRASVPVTRGSSSLAGVEAHRAAMAEVLEQVRETLAGEGGQVDLVRLRGLLVTVRQRAQDACHLTGLASL